MGSLRVIYTLELARASRAGNGTGADEAWGSEAYPSIAVWPKLLCSMLGIYCGAGHLGLCFFAVLGARAVQSNRLLTVRSSFAVGELN